MAYWFIWLGGNLPTGSLYETVAEDYGIVMIDFLIGEDLTGYSRENIKKYLRDNKLHSGSERSIGQIAGQIDTFMNHIKVGDSIISPFGKNPRILRIGKVVSKGASVETCFGSRKKELNEILDKYQTTVDQGPIGNKPGIKVEWQKNELNLDNSGKLEAELNKSMRKTVTALNIENIKNSKTFSEANKKLIKDFLSSAAKQTSHIIRNVITSLIVAGILAVLGFVYKNYF